MGKSGAGKSTLLYRMGLLDTPTSGEVVLGGISTKDFSGTGTTTAARAVAQTPDILFADEPTANLDSASGREVLAVMQELHREHGQTIVMVIHEDEYASLAGRTIVIEDGVVKEDRKTP